MRPGQQVTVYGHWYFTGECHDGDATSTAQSTFAEHVTLYLTTTSGSRLITVVHPNSGDFTATLGIPSTASRGPATITDGQGHSIKLYID